MKKLIFKVMALSMAMLLLAGCGQNSAKSGGGDGATLETAVVTHYAVIEIENYGTIKAELYGKSAPVTVANFVSLAQKGFYNGLNFHRIIEGFMMQGGAPNSVKPDAIYGEFAENGFENNLLHLRGVLSMARTSEPDSASSQFFYRASGQSPFRWQIRRFRPGHRGDRGRGCDL